MLGNGYSFFCQKPLLLLSEHNLFKLELKKGNTKFFVEKFCVCSYLVNNMCQTSLKRSNTISLVFWSGIRIAKETDLVFFDGLCCILYRVLYGQSARQLTADILLHRLSHKVICERKTSHLNLPSPTNSTQTTSHVPFKRFEILR